MDMTGFLFLLCAALVAVVVMANWLWALICPASFDTALPRHQRKARSCRRQKTAAPAHPVLDLVPGSKDSIGKVAGTPADSAVVATDANVVDLAAWKALKQGAEPAERAELRGPR